MLFVFYNNKNRHLEWLDDFFHYTHGESGKCNPPRVKDEATGQRETQSLTTGKVSFSCPSRYGHSPCEVHIYLQLWTSTLILNFLFTSAI